MVSVMSNVDTGHDDMVHDAQMDYYGTKLATCSSDRSVKIFEIKGNEHSLVAHLREHEGPVWQVAWAHPKYGNLLASCSYDRRVLIWQEDGHTWRKIYDYANHTSSVNSICWAPHEYGLILDCASSDGSVSLLTYTSTHSWDSKEISNAHNFGCNAVSWAPSTSSGSPDGSNPSLSSSPRIVTGGCDNCVKVWVKEAQGDWMEEAKLERHLDWVRDVAWAPSIGLPRSMIASCSQIRQEFLSITTDYSSFEEEWGKVELKIIEIARTRELSCSEDILNNVDSDVPETVSLAAFLLPCQPCKGKKGPRPSPMTCGQFLIAKFNEEPSIAEVMKKLEERGMKQLD